MTQSAAYARQYRAARRSLGRPVARGKGPRALSFVAWDGEGESGPAPDGSYQTAAQWRVAVRSRAGELLEDAWAADGPIWDAIAEYGGRVKPDMVRRGARWQLAGEWADVPRSRLEPNAKRSREGLVYGNADEVAQTAGLSSDDLREFLRSARRPSRAAATAQAEEELERAFPRPRRHDYTLLANSRDGVLAEDPAGLDSRRIFDALLEGGARHPGAIHVVFGGSYDANMALKSLSRADCERVWRAGKHGVSVELGGRHYSVHYRPRRSLRLGRFDRAQPWVDGRPNFDAKLCLWDVWGFFQASFVGALEAYGFPAATVEAIAAMKARRPDFSAADRAEVAAYCVRECELLEELMLQLAASLDTAGLRPAAWNGAGAVAGALLKREGVKGAIEALPEALELPVRVAYAGGRVELCQLGRAGAPIYGADVASAYPWGAIGLPALSGAQWRRVGEPRGFGLARVRFAFAGPRPWYPLYYRTERGTILFPARGEGWYWEPELRAARAFAAAWGGTVDVLEAWELEDDGRRPFGFIEPLFAQRKAWKRDKNGAEKAAKLGINSLYGKMAQQLGGTKDRPPPYFSLAWAGYVTSATRARLVEAALGDPEAVVAFSTDGIASTRPLALPNYGTELGAWEVDEALDGVWAQPGVYWLLGEGGWKPKYRGFDKEQLEVPDGVLEAWRDGRDKLELRCTRFVTLGSALASRECWDAWGTWRTVPRVLDVTGRSAKRSAARTTGPLVPLPVAWNVDYDVTGAGSAPFAIAWEDDAMLDGTFDATVEEEAAESYI